MELLVMYDTLIVLIAIFKFYIMQRCYNENNYYIIAHTIFI